MADNENKISTLGSLVPQLFFDIIAWLIPGAFLAATFVFTAVGAKELWGVLRSFETKDYPPTAIIIALGIALSYSLAIILNGLWSLPREFWQWVIRSSKKDQDNGASHKDSLTFKYHSIKHKDMDAGNIILKVKARKHMARVLAVGFLVSLSINAYKHVRFGLSSSLILYAVYSLAFIGTLVAQRKSCRDEENLIRDYSDLG